MNLIDKVEAKHLRKDLAADFQPGDTVRVHVKVIEGEKVRNQVFTGTVMQLRGSGMRSTFTVRKVSGGVGVERIFPLHSPSIAKIDVTRKGRVRRAKLTYLRGKKGKAGKILERREEETQGGTEGQ
jgi:large subunit ribosomal protein L19